MSGYAYVDGHRKMNFDAVRNPAYRKAIRDVITPDSVVLDLGAGLGMLGFLAAQAGARKVYMVDPEPVIEVTRKIAEANRLSNVECIQEKAESLDLSEKPDLIISVFTGNFLLTEDLLPSLFFARDHLLAPGGKLIPDMGRMMAAPVSVPKYYQENIENWSLEQASKHGVKHHGIDYQPTRKFAVNTLYYDSAKNLEAELLAEPACVADMDFRTATKAECDSTIKVSVTEAGVCHGWLGWFDMRLGNDWLSTSPAAEPTHWSQVFMPLEKPLKLEAGEKLEFGLKRPEYGEWSWRTSHRGEIQKQSTFLSMPLTPEVLRRKSDTFQPELNNRGKALQFVLAHMDGKTTTRSLAESVARKYSKTFISSEDALRFVKALVYNYGAK